MEFAVLTAAVEGVPRPKALRPGYKVRTIYAEVVSGGHFSMLYVLFA